MWPMFDIATMADTFPGFWAKGPNGESSRSDSSLVHSFVYPRCLAFYRVVVFESTFNDQLRPDPAGAQRQVTASASDPTALPPHRHSAARPQVADEDDAEARPGVRGHVRLVRPP